MSSALHEHIEYLSTKGRYELFERAFEKVISDGARVADLGCGVGVLGLQCLRKGAGHVVGIDASGAIHLARETMDREGLSDRYTCIAGSTFETELTQPVDALVCDHVGYFGFDYGLIDMIRDAALRLLRPGGIIVPNRLKLLIAGASSSRLRDMASAWSGESIPREFRWLDEQNRNCKFGTSVSGKELCSSAHTIGELVLDAQSPQYFSFDADLLIENSGLFDGLVGWFDCHLGGEVWMTNSPVDDRAIERPQAFFPTQEPFWVEAGDQVGVTLRFNSAGDMIAWDIRGPQRLEATSAKQSLSTFRSVILSPNDLAQQAGSPLSLSDRGEAQAFVLGLVDGCRSRAEIVRCVLKDRPEMFPSEAAARDFVERVTKRNCVVSKK